MHVCVRVAYPLPHSTYPRARQQNINGPSSHIRENSQHEIFCRRRNSSIDSFGFLTLSACQTFYVHSSSVSLAIFYSLLYILHPLSPLSSVHSFIFNVPNLLRKFHHKSAQTLYKIRWKKSHVNKIMPLPHIHTNQK